MANVPASKYLAKHSTMDNIAFGPMPTRQGQPATIASVWSMALTTGDPQRQALALALINQLLEPTVQGNWSRFTSKLPSRRSSLQVVRNAGDPYQMFLQESLDQAVARPNGPAFDAFVHRLQEALRRLFGDEVTPSEAVMQVQLSK
jgi:ABC-type glycerol-3-phosphate transport system substrate-binding protein